MVCAGSQGLVHDDTIGSEVRMVQRNIAPPSLPALLETMVGFEDHVFERIKVELRAPHSTNLTDEQFVALASDTGKSETDLRLLMSLLSFLYGQTSGLTESEVKGSLTGYLEKAVSQDQQSEVSGLVAKLSDLLNFRTCYEASEKKLRLTRGSIPFLLAAGSFVDLRADFGRKDDGTLSGEIVGQIPVVQLLIGTDSRVESEQNIVLQLDAEAVDLLQSTLDEIKEKLEIVGKTI